MGWRIKAPWGFTERYWEHHGGLRGAKRAPRCIEESPKGTKMEPNRSPKGVQEDKKRPRWTPKK